MFHPQSRSRVEDHKFLCKSESNVNTDASTANIFRYALSLGELIQPSLGTKLVCKGNPKPPKLPWTMLVVEFLMTFLSQMRCMGKGEKVFL